jgi:DNA polymerase I-like protein with 3'-5' exonuclease and polymerase domains
VLEEYATKDAELTLACYHAQRKHMSPAQIRLCYLMCQDLQILQEMEANGIPFDEKLCDTRSKEVDDKISTLNGKLAAIYATVPINFGSNDHLSAFLYGGTVKEDGKEHIGFFKSGAKAGQPKYKNIIIEHKLPRLYQPLKGSEMAKEGNYAVDEGTLRKLRGNKNIVNMILELSKLEKLNGTYYKGLVKLRNEMHWEEGVLHGNFNQTTAQTGRLSSSKPNLQNFASELQDIFISRYND